MSLSIQQRALVAEVLEVIGFQSKSLLGAAISSVEAHQVMCDAWGYLQENLPPQSAIEGYIEICKSLTVSNPALIEGADRFIGDYWRALSHEEQRKAADRKASEARARFLFGDSAVRL